MTGIVGRLEDRGLVRRQHGRTDRRKVFVTLQEPGQQIVEQVTRAWYQNGMTVFEDLDQEMLEQTVRILQMVLKRLQPEAVEYL
jgi:DNA-binding MarR family transcriptional regulator